MRRPFIYGLILSFLAVSALANPGNHTPDFERLADRLGLDDAQAEQFASAMTAQHERNQARIEPLREQMQQLHAEIKQETLTTASSVLTPEQMEKFERLQERRAERRQQRGKRMKDRSRRFRDDETS